MVTFDATKAATEQVAKAIRAAGGQATWSRGGPEPPSGRFRRGA